MTTKELLAAIQNADLSDASYEELRQLEAAMTALDDRVSEQRNALDEAIAAEEETPEAIAQDEHDDQLRAQLRAWVEEQRQVLRDHREYAENLRTLDEAELAAAWDAYYTMKACWPEMIAAKWDELISA